MQHRLKLAALAFLVSSPATSQMTESRQLDAARSIARLLQLSPEGTEIWARQTVKRATSEEYSALTRIEVDIGNELARPSPDKHRLNTLVAQYGSESGSIERERKRKELDDAFRLSSEDRQKIGQFIEKSARESLARKRPVLQPLP